MVGAGFCHGHVPQRRPGCGPAPADRENKTETADTRVKNDVVQYERTYQLLKNKIESGMLPVGT